MSAVASFLALPLGTRVVVRYRIEGGATDALGFLIARSADRCEIRTRGGDVTVMFDRIVAAKAVPPSPPRKVPRPPVR